MFWNLFRITSESFAGALVPQWVGLNNILYIIRYIYTDNSYIQTIQLTIGSDGKHSVGWLVVCGFNGPLRQYFSLCRAVSEREIERERKE